MNKAQLGLIILTLTCLQWGWVTPRQAQAQAQTPQFALATNLTPNQQIISDLKVFLDNQRRDFGNTPLNNAILRDLQKIVMQGNNGQGSNPSVVIWNQGPGRLKVLMGSGNVHWLGADQRDTYPIDRVSPIFLESAGREALVKMKQITNNSTQKGDVQFWDHDDRRNYSVPANYWHRGSVLTPGQAGYYIHRQ